ncbi:exonuclease V (RecBCD complex), alpha chain [Rubrivivax sp. A210]|uniref:exodeoxyribonuclease V subunit alpha n=1 Tax=Rubrivivax sp. A210 TaxID=2772301 RepID=UPI0019194741|nr:exodeoxyribonuclease V subunit alpha [Rubrivivax sp. A210]CAD5371685.1 exonuclease V (RecBCD complex), alpha chain [Rubrivivax sp. A210]
MTPAQQLQNLRAWREAGWLRSLDLAFAAFLHELDPQAPASLLLASALLASLEGRGHGGLPLNGLAEQAAALLEGPPEAQAAWREALAGFPTDEAACRQAWQGRPVLQFDPMDEGGRTPLVLSRGLLYLRRGWRHESRVAARIVARAEAAPGQVDAGAARALMRQLFKPSAAAIDWQQVACAVALRGRLTVITGGPGTGKTYTAARLLVLLQALHAGPQPLRVALAAPTGKAAARLRQSIDAALQGLRQALGTALPLDDWADGLGPARTLHALLGARPGTRRFRHDATAPLDLDLLVVDEASMVHLEMMAALLDALPPTARLVLLGDKDQLASVEAGAVMGDLCQGAGGPGQAGAYRPHTAQWVQALTGQTLPDDSLGDGPALAQQTVVLRESRRFAGPIGALAQALNGGDAAAALVLLRAAPAGALALVQPRTADAVAALAVAGRPGAPGGYRAYLELLAQRPAAAADFDDWARHLLRAYDGCRVLCALRDGPWGVAGLNPAIERALQGEGLLQRRGEWYEGRPVMVTRNEAALGVFNGDVGLVLKPPGGGTLRCWFLDGEALRSVSVGRLAEVETAFAMTVHKSQGSEFGHVLLVLPGEDRAVLTRELVYTGITRARLACTVVCADPAVLALAAARRTRRISGLRQRLEGPQGE